MTYQEAMAFVHQTASMGSRMGLERILELAARLGNPEKKLKFIHVAGTNGKGSVCSMTAEILKQAGYTVGMFSSPELFGFETQFLVNGEPMTREELISIAEEMKDAVDDMEDKASEFEIITVMAFLHFLRKKCDFVVLEVGMGGIDDATNIIPAPEIAAIVNIGLDHMQFLGNTVEEIAVKKAGIIKPSCHVVLADQDPSIMNVIRQACLKNGCPCTESDNSRIRAIEHNFDGQIFRWTKGERSKVNLVRVEPAAAGDLSSGRSEVNLVRVEPTTAVDQASGRSEENLVRDEPSAVDAPANGCAKVNLVRVEPTADEPQSLSPWSITTENEPQSLSLRLKLLGTHQLKNAAIVLTIIEVLNKKGYIITDEAIKKGMDQVRWPGRFEVIHRDPVFIVDGAHNPHGVTALVENLRTYFPGKKITFITGILADKDYKEMIALTLPYAKEYITVEPANARALSAEECAKTIRELGGQDIPVTAAVEGKRAIEIALAHTAEISQTTKNIQAIEATQVTESTRSAEAAKPYNTQNIICAFGSLYNVYALRQAFLSGDR